MKKHLIISNNYPHKDKIYRNGFVHARVKSYLKSGLQVDVFAVNNEEMSYEYDGIKVTSGSPDTLLSFLSKNQYDTIMIHFINSKIIRVLMQIENVPQLTVFFHGVDAYSWKRRVFTYNLFRVKEVLQLVKYILWNKREQHYLRRLYKKHGSLIQTVTVSEWMKNVVETDVKIKPQRWKIIPNYVDGELFNYIEKSPEDRYKVMLLRPFVGKIYANDIAVEAILLLSKHEVFKQFSFLIAGDGPEFDVLTEPLKQFSNVTLSKRFYTHQETAKLHKEYGVFLCPSRQDSQGVSRGEAMASGLVPITSNVAAIPEFVNDKNGFLTSSAAEVCDVLLKIAADSTLFLEMSKEASNQVNEQCGFKNTIAKELQLFEECEEERVC